MAGSYLETASAAVPIVESVRAINRVSDGTQLFARHDRLLLPWSGRGDRFAMGLSIRRELSRRTGDRVCAACRNPRSSSSSGSAPAWPIPARAMESWRSGATSTRCLRQPTIRLVRGERPCTRADRRRD
jgi:hypothetical protein